MKNVRIKIPDQHYVGMQKREEDSLPLGFMTPYEDNAAGRKRIDTVDGWVGNNWGNAKALPSKIINNVPMTGFALSDTIKRGTSWGRGNVVWRIDDPRGFELEITNDNLMQIMMCTLIVGGEIMCPCVWGREGPDNILIPTDSTLYKEAQLNTERLQKKVSMRDVKIGNTIVLQNGAKGIYLGAFYELLFDSSGGSYGSNEKTVNASSKKKHYLLTTYADDKGWKKDENKNVILSMASFKVAEIVDESTDTIKNTQQLINAAKTDPEFDIVDGQWGTVYSFIGVAGFQLSVADYKIELTKLENIQEFIENNNDYFTGRSVIVDLATQIGIVPCNAFKKDGFGQGGHVAVYHKDLLLNESRLKPVMTQKTQPSYGFGRRQYEEQLTIPIEGLAHVKDWYSGAVTFTDTETGNLVELPIRR